jgi:ankyrin repeat protein
MSFRLSAIDNEELIHTAVRQGHLISLEIYLNQNPDCINRIYTYNQSKWTPLLAACYYKHETIVRMLLNRFQPNIEMKGTVIFDMIDNQLEIVEDVSPLWTAAAVDQFDIVRLLIEHGKANINHLTKTHSTTFRVACFNNNLDMAKYLVQHGANPYQMKIGNYTNLMLSAGRRYPSLVKYLVEELGSNINAEDENGQTALYYAIKSGSTDIVKFLLDNGALNIRDKLRHVTPLMRAALYGEIDLVEVFHGYCSDLEWIEAKELLGATFGGCVAQFENLNKTIQYLTEAFQLRKSKNLPKILLQKPIEIFHFRSECETIEQFNQLIYSESNDELHIETIRIHQRLLGDMSNDYHHVLRYYGAILADKNRYDDCLRWWFYEIDLKQKYKLQYKKEYLRCFIDIFNEMKSMNISMENFIRMLEILDQELQCSRKNDSFDYNLHTLLYLMTIIARIIFSNHETNDNRRELFRVIQLILRRQYQTIDDGLSLLHLCSRSSTIQFSDGIR